MTKDPACLFYINDWLTSTAEMDADCRGWYLNLLLHNYDKETLPNEIEKLAVLCNVKFSEYQRFEHVFEHVLKQKFEQLGDGRLSNNRTQSILKAREVFKEKRSNAGKASYLMRYFYEKFKKESKDKKLLLFVKSNINTEIDTKNEQIIEHMFKQVFELYRNETEIENKEVLLDSVSKGDKVVFDFSKSSEEFKKYFLEEFISAPKQKKKSKELKSKILVDLQNYDEPFAIELMKKAVLNNWQGYKFDKTDEQYADYLRKKQNTSISQWPNGSINGVQRSGSKQSYHVTVADFAAALQTGEEN